LEKNVADKLDPIEAFRIRKKRVKTSAGPGHPILVRYGFYKV